MLSEEEKASLMLSAESELRQIRGGHADVQKQLDTTKNVVKELTDGVQDEEENGDEQ
jgi:uridine kinase